MSSNVNEFSLQPPVVSQTHSDLSNFDSFMEKRRTGTPDVLFWLTSKINHIETSLTSETLI